MFLSDNLIFVELHKTGGTHILNLLEQITKGQRIGKHNRVPEEYHDRFIIGSIRNPWDWYVSLWAYGCSSRGSVQHQLTRGVDLRYNYRLLPGEMEKKYLTPGEWFHQVRNDLTKPVDQWRSLYRDSNDAEAFRQWLTLLLSPERKLDMAEGYGFFPLAGDHGLLTYRYLKLFTRLGDRIYDHGTLAHDVDLDAIWQHYAITRFIIRNEALEEDLIHALEYAGIRLTDCDRQMILAGRSNKSNTSERGNTSKYYDDDTRRLVAERERFIIARHGYQPVD